MGPHPGGAAGPVRGTSARRAGSMPRAVTFVLFSSGTGTIAAPREGYASMLAGETAQKYALRLASVTWDIWRAGGEARPDGRTATREVLR